MEQKLTARFELKAADDAGKFTGRASVYGVVDSYSDVVMPGAFTDTIKKNNGMIRILNQHNPEDVIGKAKLVDREDGLYVEGQLELQLQSARDAYVRLKSGLLDGLSIGYATEGERYVGNVRQLTAIQLFEVSLVTFPANEEARITAVKQQSADARLTDSLQLMTLHLAVMKVRANVQSAIKQAQLDHLKSLFR